MTSVLVANNIAWAVGDLRQRRGILLMCVCGWLAWGMSVVRMVASVVVRSWSPTT
jgi:hypothetical protein